jgi:predicted PurR-regulated permease PerM
MTSDRHGIASRRDELFATWIDVTIRFGILAFLIYLSIVLVRPFISIVIWSVVLTIALYPIYAWLVERLGGRRRLAAFLLTILNLMIVIGPVTWLALGLIDSFQTLSERFGTSALVLPPPPAVLKSWPIVGGSIYQFWNLASTNIEAAFAQVVPHLKPLGTTLLQIATDAGTGVLKFFVAIIVAGFLFSPAPKLLEAVIMISRRVASGRGEAFVNLAGATIRAVARGVIGISALQALLAGVGLVVAGVPGTSLITSAVLILGIIQIGPSIIIFPLIIWSWIAMEATTALLFTAYMIPVNLLDNVLRPLVLGRGLNTPMLIILIGVIGGTVSFGISGLFLGPIVLAVIWELLLAWSREPEAETPAADKAT